jgi:DNA-binding MarR family transcriptional regulator
LVKKEKDPENKRQNLLSLTDEGKKFADKIEQYEREWENAICNNDMEYKEEFLKHIQYIAGESVKLVYKEDCNE